MNYMQNAEIRAAGCRNACAIALLVLFMLIGGLSAAHCQAPEHAYKFAFTTAVVDIRGEEGMDRINSAVLVWARNDTLQIVIPAAPASQAVKVTFTGVSWVESRVGELTADCLILYSVCSGPEGAKVLTVDSGALYAIFYQAERPKISRL